MAEWPELVQWGFAKMKKKRGGGGKKKQIRWEMDIKILTYYYYLGVVADLALYKWAKTIETETVEFPFIQ